MSYEPKILFHGSKNFWRTKTNLEVTLAYHPPFSKIEILAEDPASTSFEDAERRMYIDVPTLKRQLDHDVLEREALYAQANLYDQKIYTEYDEIYLDILLKLGKDYLLSRLQMRSSAPNSPATSSSQHMSPSSSLSHHPQTTWSIFLQPLPKDEIDPDTGRPAVQCDRPLELEPIRCHRHAAYAAHAPHDGHYRSSELPSLLLGTPDHKRSRTPPPATPASTPSSYYGHSATSATSSGALPAFPAHGKHDGSAHHNNSSSAHHNNHSNGNQSHLHAQLQGAVELDAQFALQAPPGTRRPSIGTSTNTSTSTSNGKKGVSGGTSHSSSHAPRTLAPLHLPTPSPSSIASPSPLPFSNLAKVHRAQASTSTSTTPAHRSHPQPLPGPSPLASPRTPEVVAAAAEEKSCNNNNTSPKSPAQHKDSSNSNNNNSSSNNNNNNSTSASSQQDVAAQASAQAGTFFAAAVVRAYSNQSNTCNNNNSPGRVNPSLTEASAQAFSSDDEGEDEEVQEGEREGEGVRRSAVIHMAGEASTPQHARWADEVRGASDFDYALQQEPAARAKKPPPRGTNNATRRSREKIDGGQKLQES
eukprot:gene30400-36729_t